MLLRLLICISTLLISAPAAAQVFKLKTMEQYTRAFKSDTPMITMYTSVRCGPCKMMKPSLHKMAKHHRDISFFVLDIDTPDFSGLLKELGIRSLPHLIFSNKGEKLISEVGSMGTKSLEQCINKFQSEINQQTTRKRKKTVTKKQSPKTTMKKEAPVKIVPSPSAKKKQKTS